MAGIILLFSATDDISSSLFAQKCTTNEKTQQMFPLNRKNHHINTRNREKQRKILGTVCKHRKIEKILHYLHAKIIKSKWKLDTRYSIKQN